MIVCVIIQFVAVGTFVLNVCCLPCYNVRAEVDHGDDTFFIELYKKKPTIWNPKNK